MAAVETFCVDACKMWKLFRCVTFGARKHAIHLCYLLIILLLYQCWCHNFSFCSVFFNTDLALSCVPLARILHFFWTGNFLWSKKCKIISQRIWRILPKKGIKFFSFEHPNRWIAGIGSSSAEHRSETQSFEFSHHLIGNKM